jgi:hypothetical protein
MIKAYVFLALALSPVLALAHAGGPSIEKVIGDYAFDIGYSQEPVEGELVRFDLALSPAKGGDEIAFTSAWVRIEGEGGKTVFAGPIAYGEFGRPGFSVVFPREGAHELFVRFQKGPETIAESEFPLLVAPSEEGRPMMPFIGALVAGSATGFLFALAIRRKKHV